LISLQDRLRQLESDRSKIDPKSTSNDIKQKLFQSENLVSKTNVKVTRIERFDHIWKRYVSSRSLIEHRMKPGQDMSRDGLERLEDDFKNCSENFGKAFEALDVGDREGEKSKFDKFVKDFDSFLKNQEKIFKDFEKTSFENLDQIETGVDEIEVDEIVRPEKPKTFSASRDMEAEIVHLETKIDRLKILQTGLKNIEIEPKIDQIDKLAKIQRNINSKLEALKNIINRLKEDQEKLIDFESNFGDFESNFDRWSQVFNTEGAVTRPVAKVNQVAFNLILSILIQCVLLLGFNAISL